MSLRTLAFWFALLCVAGGAAGCGRHGARRPPSSTPAAVVTGANVGNGKAVYEAQCAACHGQRGIGGAVGPALQNESMRRSYQSVYAFVRDPSPPMPKLYPSVLTRSDLRDVSAYVESL